MLGLGRKTSFASSVGGASTVITKGGTIFGGKGNPRAHGESFSVRDGDSYTAADDGAESTTEEVHHMTKAEAEYMPTDMEHDFIQEITNLVRERLVLGNPSTSFGLKWQTGTATDPAYTVGGWLAQCGHAGGLLTSSSVVTGPMRFCVMDDAVRIFKQCNDENASARRTLSYDEISTVRPRIQEKPSVAYYVQIFSKNKRWELMSVTPNDRDLMMRWIAALQMRTGTYEASLAADVTRALKVALWCQSVLRMRRAKRRVQRRRERRAALTNRLAHAMGLGGWDAADSDDSADDADEEDEEEQGYAAYALGLGQTLVASAWTAVGSWLGLGGAAPLLEVDEEEVRRAEAAKDAEEAALLRTRERRASNYVQTSHDLPPMGQGEIEDEVWENQRWDPVNGWSSKALGLADRAAFSDRLGRATFPSVVADKVEGGVPLDKTHWRAVQAEYAVDTSGVVKGKCDKEGWTYSSSFPLLDSDLAKGKYIAHNPGGLAGLVCRRRRWYRRRAPLDAKMLLKNTTSPILAQGWLGTKSSSTGRWRSRYFVLTRPGLEIGTLPGTIRQGSTVALTRANGPVLTSFRFSFRGADLVLANGGTDPKLWRELTDKQASSFELDPRRTRVDESVATLVRPGVFSLQIETNGKRTHRTYNAMETGARATWTAAINEALREATVSRRPKTLRLVGGSFETTSYPTILMDSLLLVPVDAVEEACYQSPAVQAAIAVRSNYINFNAGEWNTSAGTRVVEYEVPAHASSGEKMAKVVEKWTRARTEPGQGFVVDRHVTNAGAQFGDEYAIKTRTVLVAATLQGEKGCRVIVSMEVEFVKKTMMVGYITSTAKKELTEHLAHTWFPCVVGYLGGKGLIHSSAMVPAKKVGPGRPPRPSTIKDGKAV